MRKLSSKQIMLAFMLVALAGILYVQYERGIFSSTAPGQDIRAAGKAADPAALASLVEVSLDPPPPVDIRPNSRNLFNYSRSPDEIADEIRQRKEAERLAAEAEARRRQQAEDASRLVAARAAELVKNPPRPPPPAISFRFIGKMGEPKAPVAILADAASGEVLTVREGEVIAEKFRVRKIDYDSVTIGYVNPEWTETKTIKMGS